MNYRHAYHAGNFADCMKHALLIPLVSAMQRKPKPFLFLDTHAGIGYYDLESAEAQKTGEWQNGIGRILATKPPELTNYTDIVTKLGLYPGSPAIAASMLRPDDRLIACELHSADAATLKRSFAYRKNIAIHERNGYEALKAFLPPPERRALILIDPPFEAADEMETLLKNLEQAWQRFETATYAVWYPIKHRAPVRSFFDAIQASKIRDVIDVEFLLRPPLDPQRLNGCGLLIVNAPFDFTEIATPILAALKRILGDGAASSQIERLIDE